MNSEEYSIKMNKKEMLEYYSRKIINEAIVKCDKDSNCFVPTIFIADKLLISNLEEIVDEINKDNKVVKATLDKNFYEVDIHFYGKYCPRYYNEDREINNKEGYEFVNIFVNFLKRIYPHTETNTRDILMKCLEYECPSDKDIGVMYEVISKILNESGFVDKYINEYTVHVNEINLPELIEIMEKTRERIEKNIENGEIENG